MTAAIAAQPAAAPATPGATPGATPAPVPAPGADAGFAALVALALGQLPVTGEAAATPTGTPSPAAPGKPAAGDAKQTDDSAEATPGADPAAFALAAVLVVPIVPVVPTPVAPKVSEPSPVAAEAPAHTAAKVAPAETDAAAKDPRATPALAPDPVTSAPPTPAAPTTTTPTNAPTPVTTPVPTTAPLTAAPTTTPVPRPAHVVAGQVIPEVTRLVSRGEGVHRVTLELNPRALGEVRVVLTLRHGDVHVRLAAGAEARVALAQSSGELSRALEQLGIKDHRISLAALPGDTGVNAGLRDQSQQAQPDTTHDQTRQQNHAGGFSPEHQQQDHHSWKGADSLATDGALTHHRTDTTAVPVSISSPTAPAAAGSVDVRM